MQRYQYYLHFISSLVVLAGWEVGGTLRERIFAGTYFRGFRGFLESQEGLKIYQKR